MASVATVPAWYWPVIAVAMVGLAVVADSRVGAAIAVATVGFVVIVLAATAAAVIPRYRRAQWRNDLLGPRGAMTIVVFVLGVVGGTLGLAFALLAAGVSHPATIACSLCALVLIVGGPLVMRRLQLIMAEA